MMRTRSELDRLLHLHSAQSGSSAVGTRSQVLAKTRSLFRRKLGINVRVDLQLPFAASHEHSYCCAILYPKHPSVSRRELLARERRDITVPIGIDNASEISRYDISS